MVPRKTWCHADQSRIDTAEHMATIMVSRKSHMFFRSKQSGGRTYLQLVQNEWRDGRAQQRVIATLGRLDRLVQSGGLDSLIRSGARFNRLRADLPSPGAGQPRLSSRQVGQMLQVSPSTVTGW